jgi:hypothetical protein
LDQDLLNLPFDQYQRYCRVADLIRVLPIDSRGLLLDVGGHSRLAPNQDFPLLSPFLPGRRVVVLDQLHCCEPGYVQGNGLTLPFADTVFACVVSVDTLEHIPVASRHGFVQELLRVAGQYVVLAAPFQAESIEPAERTVFNFSAALTGVGHPQIGEHRALGLPDLAEWRSYLQSSGWEVVTLPNGYLPRWLVMMLVRHYFLSLPGGQELCQQVDRLYNGIFYSADHRAPAYRQILVTARPPASLEALMQGSEKNDEPLTSAEEMQAFFRSPLWDKLAQREKERETDIRHSRQERDRLQAELSRLQASRAAQARSIVALQARVEGFERGRFIRLMAWLKWWQRRIGRMFQGGPDA